MPTIVGIGSTPNPDSVNSNQQDSKEEEIGGQPLDPMDVDELEPIPYVEEQEAQDSFLN